VSSLKRRRAIADFHAEFPIAADVSFDFRNGRASPDSGELFNWEFRGAACKEQDHCTEEDERDFHARHLAADDVQRRAAISIILAMLRHTLLAATVITTSALAQNADPFAEGVRTTEPLAPAEQRAKFKLPPGVQIPLVAARATGLPL
jgi:hypothetical protein